MEASAQLLGSERNSDGSITLNFGGGNTITTTSNGSYTSTGTGFCSSCANMLPPVTVYATVSSNNTYNYTSLSYNGQYYQVPPDPNVAYYGYMGSVAFSTAPSPTATPTPPPYNPCKSVAVSSNTNTNDPAGIDNPAYAVQVASLRNSVGVSGASEQGMGMGINPANGHIVQSPIFTGTTEGMPGDSMASQTPGILYAIIHTHPANGYPTPSVDDYYNLIIDNHNFYHSEYTGYIFAANGDTYAYTVSDYSAAGSFAVNNPPSSSMYNGTWASGTAMANDYTSVMTALAKLSPTGTLSGQALYDANEVAQAYVLDNNNVGITLSKMDAQGNFHQIHTVKTTDANGNNTFTRFNCN